MLHSMTGFARRQQQDEMGTIIWEIRSVNHRYLDITPRLPELLRPQEMRIRELVHAKCQRGKVEVICKFNPGGAFPASLNVNEDTLMQLKKITLETKKTFPEASLSLMEILAWPGVVQTQETGAAEVVSLMLSLLNETLEELQQVRAREGEKTSRCLQSHLEEIQQLVKKIVECVPGVIANQRQRIEEKFTQLQLEVDQDRLEQEIVWFIQKTDINEELSRLQAHIDEAKRIIDKGGVAGRRLDFLMQEFNRETNTICSKSVDYQVTQSALKMKVIIEQMREQVQNVE